MSTDVAGNVRGGSRAGLSPSLQQNDRKANVLIIAFSIVVFLIVAALSPLHKVLGIQSQSLGFDVHVFAKANAVINTIVTILLLAALYLVKQKKYVAHRNTMYAAMILSVLFLVSYITHHILAGDSLFGDIDHNGILSSAERAAAGTSRTIYLLMLTIHIALAAIILPFILFTAYRGMTGQYARHKKLSRYTYPLWLYVAITGPIIYLMISPYYA